MRRECASIKIKLTFDKIPDLEALQDGILIEIFRIIANIKFLKGKEWASAFKAIVDTGAPMTLIPKFIWEQIEFKILSPKEYGILGISPPGTEKISTKLVCVTAAFADAQNVSPPVPLRCRLLPDNSIPLVIGFLDFLDRYKLVLDYKNNTAYLEF